MGIPYRVVISDKTLADDKVEYTERQSGDQKLLTLTEIEAILSEYEKDSKSH